MNFDDYQHLAVRTARKYQNHNFGSAVFALGLAGEAGEVADYIKKVVGHDHPLDRDVLEKEMGDVMWYLAVLAEHHGMHLEDIAEKNIEKLKKRYPEGFSVTDSINRED